MNNCIIQGKITNLKEEVLFRYNDLKAQLTVYMQIDCNKENVMQCIIYDEKINEFLDKYLGNGLNSYIFLGHLRNTKNNRNRGAFLEVKEIY